MNQTYLKTARLLILVAPTVFETGEFALKGGTAINLFFRDMPRLSVDLDLVFVNHLLDRKSALTRIETALRRCRQKFDALGMQTRLVSTTGAADTKLLVRRDEIEVKVEVNTVMRGTVYSNHVASMTAKAQEILLADLEIPVVSFPDLFGGKLVAALDRQHPRDLFDMMQLLAHEGITPEVRRAFVVYLASHDRPTHEVLAPNAKDITQEFEQNFRGMTSEPVNLTDLLTTRDRIISEVPKSLDDAERQFLLSLAGNKPDWSILGIDHIQHLPGIRWKVQNLAKLQDKNPAKFAEQRNALGRILD